MPYVYALSFLTAWFCLAQDDLDPKAVKPPEGLVPEALLQMGDTFTDYAFVMDKTSRTLSVWKHGKDHPEFVAAHPADMGRTPGNKSSSGDFRTPEGIYFFEKKLESKELDFNEYGNMAFTMNYPNLFDRFEKKTGGGIWLHAIPDTKSLLRGSRGCVVVRNNIISTLNPYIQIGRTPIVVTDKVKYVSAEELVIKRSEVLTWLEAWRKDWESKDIDAYIQFYHDGFSSTGMNKSAWRNFKKTLNEKYSFIKVELKEPAIFVQGDKWIIHFYQVYQSDQKTDFGEKTLFVTTSKSRPAILGEVWQPLADQQIARKLSSQSEPQTF